MRVPKRKPPQYNRTLSDTYITPEKLTELKNQLERLKKTIRPRAAKELKHLAEMGDLSDNAAYSIAKGKIRGINQRIEDIEHQIKNADLIAPTQNDRVEIGSTVTIEINGKQHTYRILGSTETRPEQGIISYLSPLGEALLRHKTGDTVLMKTGATQTSATTKILIIKIE